MKVKVTESTLANICAERIVHILKKNADYGDAWQNNEGFTPLLRMREKLLRVETLSDGRKAMVEDESVDQDVAEIFDYALLYLLWKSWQPTLEKEDVWRVGKMPEIKEAKYNQAVGIGNEYRQLSFDDIGKILGGIENGEENFGKSKLEAALDTAEIIILLGFGVDSAGDLFDDDSDVGSNT